MTTIVKNNKSWIAGLFAAIAASLCCIAPVLAFLGGASGLASSFAWIEPFRPYLVGLTIVFFTFAWYYQLKPQKQADCDCATERKLSFWQSKTFLVFLTIVAGSLIAFPYYATMFYPRQREVKKIITDKSSITVAQLNIHGMDCEACTISINAKLSKVNGVIAVNTSYKNANAVIQFDSRKIAVDSLVAIISNMGYKVNSSTISNK